MVGVGNDGKKGSADHEQVAATLPILAAAQEIRARNREAAGGK
jgi:hypothetical protein